MKTRCLNSRIGPFKYYGGCGVIVCDEWRDAFVAFRDWALSHGYRDDLTLDRIDNDGDYEPGNCRWATYKEQGRNKRNNRPVIRSDGRSYQSLAEAAEDLPNGRGADVSAVCRGRQKTHRGFRFRYMQGEIQPWRE